jgi:outer membrane protein OmpA-like peptidoglycan-associated protein
MKARWLWCSLVALVVAVPAGAQPPPTTAAHRDPDAPCYRWPAVDMDGDGVFDRIDHCVSTPVGCTVDKWGCESDADKDGVCDGRDNCANTPMGSKVDANGCSEEQRGAMKAAAVVPQAVTPTPPPSPPPAPEPVLGEKGQELARTGRIRLDNVYFDNGAATLAPESENTLDKVGQALEQWPDLKVEIEGHTDTRGSAPYNMKLSQQRAEAVRHYLLTHFNLQADHVTARGYGETQPETKERNDKELQQNRRVMLHALNPEVLPNGVKVQNKK